MKTGAAVFEFTWTDAWVLTALYMSHKNGSAINLPILLRTGEELNFNTFDCRALNDSLGRLVKNGLIQIRDKSIHYTSLGRQIISKARFRPGGWFSRVDITLRTLNNSETGTAEAAAAVKSPLIGQDQYDEAYARYLGQPAQPPAIEPFDPAAEPIEHDEETTT